MQPIANKRSCVLDRLLLVICSENMLPQKMMVRGLVSVSSRPWANISSGSFSRGKAVNGGTIVPLLASINMVIPKTIKTKLPV